MTDFVGGKLVCGGEVSGVKNLRKKEKEKEKK